MLIAIGKVHVRFQPSILNRSREIYVFPHNDRQTEIDNGHFEFKKQGNPHKQRRILEIQSEKISYRVDAHLEFKPLIKVAEKMNNSFFSPIAFWTDTRTDRRTFESKYAFLRLCKLYFVLFHLTFFFNYYKNHVYFNLLNQIRRYLIMKKRKSSKHTKILLHIIHTDKSYYKNGYSLFFKPDIILDNG